MKTQLLSLLFLTSAFTGSAFGMSQVKKQKKATSQQHQVELDEHLLGACKDNDPLEVVDGIVQLGASVNVRNYEGHSPLSLAMYSDNFPLVQLLVRRGAHVNTQDSEGGTPLTFAASSNDINWVKFFVENGARVDATTNKGDTALGWAVKRKNYPMAEFLLQHGAPVNSTRGFNNSPLMYATNLVRKVNDENHKMKKLLLRNFFKPVMPVNCVASIKRA